METKPARSLLASIAFDLLFAVLLLLYPVGRWFVRQVLGRLAWLVLLLLASVLLTDAEKGEPQPAHDA